ncbi:von Willebrand factor type A domain [Globodera pallida]|nr:von Willebrand factor type A domain [Globodera pallida]
MTTPWYEADEGMAKGSEGGEKTSFDGGVLEVRCVAPAGIRAILTPSTEFESANRSLISLFAKGFHEQRDCYAELDGRENIPLEIGEGQCGLSRVESTTPPGSNLSVVLIFASRRTLRLSPVEHSFLLQCFLPASPPPAVLNADLDTNAPPQPISHTISLEMTPPKCSYSLRRDSPNGPVVEKAHIGQTIYHRWECQGGKESNAVFGMRISDCSVANHSSNSDQQHPPTDAAPMAIVDSGGCSTDSALLTDLQYADDRMLAVSRATVFSLRESVSLRFSCKLTLCLRREGHCNGISPPRCSAAVGSPALVARPRFFSRRLQNEFDASAMEALSTEVLSSKFTVTSSSPSSPNRQQLHRSSPASLTSSSRPFGSVLAMVLFLVAAVLLGALLGMTAYLLTARRQRHQRRRVVQWVLARPMEEDSAAAAGAEVKSEEDTFYDIDACTEEGHHRRQKDEAARTLCRRDTDRSKRTKATVSTERRHSVEDVLCMPGRDRK